MEAFAFQAADNNRRTHNFSLLLDLLLVRLKNLTERVRKEAPEAVVLPLDLCNLLFLTQAYALLLVQYVPNEDLSSHFIHHPSRQPPSSSPGAPSESNPMARELVDGLIGFILDTLLPALVPLHATVVDTITILTATQLRSAPGMPQLFTDLLMTHPRSSALGSTLLDQVISPAPTHIPPASAAALGLLAYNLLVFHNSPLPAAGTPAALGSAAAPSVTISSTASLPPLVPSTSTASLGQMAISPGPAIASPTTAPGPATTTAAVISTPAATAATSTATPSAPAQPPGPPTDSAKPLAPPTPVGKSTSTPALAPVAKPGALWGALSTIGSYACLSTPIPTSLLLYPIHLLAVMTGNAPPDPPRHGLISPASPSPASPFVDPTAPLSSALMLYQLPPFLYSRRLTWWFWRGCGDAGQAPLSTRSLALLLVLASYRMAPVDPASGVATSGPGWSTLSPYARMLRTMQDSILSAVSVDPEAAPHEGALHISFSALFNAIARNCSELHVVLLYTLLYGNATFRQYTWPAPTLTLALHQLEVGGPAIGWYRDHALGPITMGSFIVVILVRALIALLPLKARARPSP
ncbi:hypothetical protein PAPYR_3096 [Paratrimastix pyriformis]|uniref:Dymeclin n=1 Tax=Paratrimastix pyriformis TaxID=342808 RepID=A0ABQ8UMS9_9EUKA|nr:hypothetical protein PAPYR_3096 [Paratrimastix pyriformis]